MTPPIVKSDGDTESQPTAPRESPTSPKIRRLVLEAAQNLLAGEAEAARSKYQEAHQAVIRSAKLFMVEDFEKRAGRLKELEDELIPLWREVWAFLETFVGGLPGDMRPHAMPAQSMNNMQLVAAKYRPIIPDEAGHMQGQHSKALHARLNSLIAGEQGR